MMKKCSSLLALFMITAALHAQSLSFTLQGTIDDPGEPAKVVFQYFAEGKRLSDTVALTSGSFSFKGTVDKPRRALLYLLRSSDNPRMGMGMGYGGEVMGRDGVQFYLDKGTISIKGKTIKTATISGSVAQTEYEELKKNQQPVVAKLTALNEQMGKLAGNRESEEYKDLYGKLITTLKEMTPIEEDFIRSHPNSWVSWNQLADKTIISDPTKFQALYNSVNAKFRNSEEGKKVQDKIQAAFKTAIGAVAPNFTQNDTDSKPVSLASLRGKYVLIDFWASWCGPCRAENPNVKLAYEKFRGKNFEILAVSLDNKRDAWLKAIADDGLPWLHVSDLNGWKNVVAVQYNVQAVPQNWLIDPNGVIIAANMRGKELEEKLASVLGSTAAVKIKGKMNGDTKGFNKVYLYGTGVKPDSAVMKDGSFEFILPFEKPFTPLFYTEYDKSVKRMYTPYVVLVEGPGEVLLSDGDITQGMGSMKVSGMQSAEQFNLYRQQQAAMYKKINEQLQAKYGKAWLTRDDPNFAAFNKDREELAGKATTKLLEDFVQQYPDSYAAAFALSGNGRTGVSLADLERIHAMLSKKRQQSDEGKIITDYITGVKGSSIGSMVKDFTLNTPEEKPFSFSQLKGKYVLIDFWASWCGPCKASFPHMKEVYKKYKSDKFEIYSISIDKDKAAWLKGLKEQELPWLQTLDTKNISQSGFAVTGVPTTYLIDPQGTILMKEVGFEPGGNSPLEKKLVELFGQK